MAFTPRQDRFRFGYDDGTESTHSWRAGENENVTLSRITGKPWVHARGRITVTPAPHVHASGTITCNTHDPTAGETFQVGSQKFTFVASGTSPGDVVINTTPANQAANIVTSINRDIPLQVGASAALGVVTVTAVTEDADIGNAIACYPIDIHGCLDFSSGLGGSLEGGTNQVPQNGDTFVVGTQTFTIKASGTATGDVVWSGDPTSLGHNIETSVNRDVPTIVSAVHTLGVVELTAIAEGWLGNDVVFSSTEPPGIDLSPAAGRLSQGADGVPGFLLRIGVQETGGTLYANHNFTWKYSHNGGAYANITTTSSYVRAIAVDSFVNGDAATKRLSGTGTFMGTAGCTTDGTSGNNDDFPASGNSEAECGLGIVEAQVVNGDTLDFEVTMGTALAYDAIPRLTIGERKPKHGFVNFQNPGIF